MRSFRLMKIGDWSLVLMLATGAVFGACNGESAPPESPPPVSAEPAMPAPAPDAGATAAAATAMPAVEAATSSAATDTPPAPSSPEAATEPPAASGGKGHHGHGSEGEATPSTSAYSGDDPCQTKNFHFSAVSSACKSGGRKAAKNLMRSVVKKAKDAGQSVQCNSCHDDMKSFSLKGNAVGDLKQWL